VTVLDIAGNGCPFKWLRSGNWISYQL